MFLEVKAPFYVIESAASAFSMGSEAQAWILSDLAIADPSVMLAGRQSSTG